MTEWFTHTHTHTHTDTRKGWQTDRLKQIEALIHQLSTRAQLIINSFDSQDCAISLWAVAKFTEVNVQDFEFPFKLIHQLSTRAQLIINSFNSQACSNSLWAVAKFTKMTVQGFEFPFTFIRQLLGRSRSIVEDFNSQECSSSRRSLRKLARNVAGFDSPSLLIEQLSEQLESSCSPVMNFRFLWIEENWRIGRMWGSTSC